MAPGGSAVFARNRLFLSMHLIFRLTIFFLLAALPLRAQFEYRFAEDITATENGNSLPNPFGGGCIAPQFSTIDLDLDGTLDLFVFDRASQKTATFLLKNGTYTYVPYYESLFPPNLKNWVLLRDYNCDGKPDLFTSSIFGMSVYKNTSSASLSWELAYQTVYTQGANGQVNLQVNSGDLPAIEDVDMDGDLDILVFNFALGGGIEFHKNQVVEKGLPCDLDLERITRTYGNFKECTCETYAFAPNDCPTGGKIAHVGGKSILSFRHSSSQVQDVVIGQEACSLPGYLPNTGTTQQPEMRSVSFNFPVPEAPLRIVYPAFYGIDLYDDGSLELLAAYNLFDGSQNYTQGPYAYKQTSSVTYELLTNRFLSEGMIDGGAYAAPAFTDIDFDGDEDMLLAVQGQLKLYENTGNAVQPAFLLKDENYLKLSSLQLERMQLQFSDVNADGWTDLLIYAVQGGILKAWMFPHSGNPVAPYQPQTYQPYLLPALATNDSPWLVKIEDTYSLLVGKVAGNLERYTSPGWQSPSWTKQDDAYLDIAPDFSHRHLRVITGDVNNDGLQDLIRIDNTGMVRVIRSFETDAVEFPLEAVAPMAGNYQPSFGLGAQLALAQLTRGQPPSLAVGMLTGGVQLWQNLENTGGELDHTLQLTLYPNPGLAGRVKLQSSHSGWFRVFGLAGHQVLAPQPILAHQPVLLPAWLTAGLYVVEVYTPKGQSAAVVMAIN